MIVFYKNKLRILEYLNYLIYWWLLISPNERGEHQEAGGMTQFINERTKDISTTSERFG